VAAEHLGLERIRRRLYEKLTDRKADKASVKTAPNVVKAIRGFSLQGGKVLLDMSEIILIVFGAFDYCGLWLVHVAGIGTARSAYESNKEQIANVVANSCTPLHDKEPQIVRALRLQTSHDPGRRNCRRSSLSPGI
jgi:hypothetical protein